MNILFVCTGNTCRSPMAEGFFNNYSNNSKSSSAGISVMPGSVVSVFSVESLKEYSIDISDHIPVQVNSIMLNDCDMVLTMTLSHQKYLRAFYPEYANKIFSISEYTGCKDISDPYGGDINTYKKCASEIKNAVDMLIERIKQND